MDKGLALQLKTYSRVARYTDFSVHVRILSAFVNGVQNLYRITNSGQTFS